MSERISKEIYSERARRLEAEGYSSYQEYLGGNEWREIKKKIRRRKSAKWSLCNICGTDQNLNIHHSSYKVIGTANPGNTVKVLCQPCHYEVHEYSKGTNVNLYRACNHLKKRRQREGLPVWTHSLPVL